jgi:hypothetical protein
MIPYHSPPSDPGDWILSDAMTHDHAQAYSLTQRALIHYPSSHLLLQELVAPLLQPHWGQVVALECPRLVPFVVDLKIVAVSHAVV